MENSIVCQPLSGSNHGGLNDREGNNANTTTKKEDILR